MIFFPGLDIEKSKRWRWLSYKEPVSKWLERYLVLFLLGFLFTCCLLLFISMSPGKADSSLLGCLLMLLLMLLWLYLFYLKVMEKFLKKCKTPFDKGSNKALLQQFATRQGWQPKHLVGDCLVYAISGDQVNYRNATIMIFLVEDGHILYTLLQKRSRLDIPSLSGIWLLRGDLKKWFRAKTVEEVTAN